MTSPTPIARLLPALRFAVPALVAFALLANAHAQSTTPAEDPVQLSAFEVKAGSTNGYLAAESATGTRYAAANREIPFPVNVITSEFIENYLAFDFSDVVAYTSNFTPTEGTGAFNLRGVRNFSHYKNGIREGGVYGPVSVERVEIIKGANASIYGQTEPTGLRNIVTKKAGPTPASSLRINVGTDNFSRVALDVNQPVVAGKLLTRFAASTENSEQFIQDYSKFRRVTAYNSTTWRIDPTTALTVNSEYIKFRSQAQNSAGLPFVITPQTVNGVAVNPFTGILGAGLYERFQYLNLAGPLGYNQVEYTQIDGTLTHKFNDTFSVRALGNHWIRAQNIVRTNAITGGTNANTYNSVTGVIPGTFAPRLERNHQWQDNAQVDFLTQFRTPGIEHKFLITGDYLITDTDARQRTSTRADRFITLNDALNGGPGFNPAFPYAFNFDDATTWNVRASDQRQQTISKGVMASERAAFFDGRLIAYAGARRDYTRNTTIDNLNVLRDINGVSSPVGQMLRYRPATADTVQFGATGKITSGLSAYANYSEAFNPQRQDIATNIDVNGNPLDNIKGKGWETGFKAVLLDNRLNFTLGYFDIKRSNVARVARDAAGTAILIPGTTAGSTRQYSVLNDVGSKGYEFDFNWRVTDDFSLFGGLGYNEVKYLSVPNPTEQFLLGVTPDNSPKWSGGISGDYAFRTGKLKGFSLRVGLRYQGSMLINNSTASIFGNSGVKGAPVTIGGTRYDQYFFSNSAYALVDAGLGYSWKNGTYRQRVSLDVKNIADKKYLRATKPGDPRSLNLSYDIKL
jgi:iron complex outermembrane receptor protein